MSKVSPRTTWLAVSVLLAAIWGGAEAYSRLPLEPFQEPKSRWHLDWMRGEWIRGEEATVKASQQIDAYTRLKDHHLDGSGDGGDEAKRKLVGRVTLHRIESDAIIDAGKDLVALPTDEDLTERRVVSISVHDPFHVVRVGDRMDLLLAPGETTVATPAAGAVIWWGTEPPADGPQGVATLTDVVLLRVEDGGGGDTVAALFAVRTEQLESEDVTLLLPHAKAYPMYPSHAPAS